MHDVVFFAASSDGLQLLSDGRLFNFSVSPFYSFQVGQGSLFFCILYNSMSSSNQQQGNLKQALVAGACAGTAVDTALFPLGKKKKRYNYA